MTDNKKYEVNRRYPFEEGCCPVDGEAVVTVWLKTKARDCASGKALDLYWGNEEVTHFMVLEYPPEKKVRWVNMYKFFHKTKEEADLCASGSRTACVKVDYFDGEGL